MYINRYKYNLWLIVLSENELKYDFYSKKNYICGKINNPTLE